MPETRFASASQCQDVETLVAMYMVYLALNQVHVLANAKTCARLSCFRRRITHQQLQPMALTLLTPR